MKNSIFIFSACVWMTVTLTNCNSPNRRNVEAQTEEEANKKGVPQTDEKNASEDSVTDIDHFRKEMDNRITANRQRFAELKSKVNGQKTKASADYKRKINELEEKNNNIKKRMDEYTVDGKENWETFKNGFNHDMNELEKSLNELTSNKK